MARYSARATGEGAVKGASLGSILGPWGAAAGGAIGGVSGFFGSRSTKKSRDKAKKAGAAGKAGFTRLPTLDPIQQMLQKEQLKGIYGKGKFADQYKFDKDNPLYKFDRKAANVYKFDKDNPLLQLDKQAAKVYKYRPSDSVYQFDQNNPLYNYDANLANQTFNQSVAAPAYQQFAENVVPTITGQFRGQNLQNSSYLGGALGKAATDVQKGLDAQRANMIYSGTEAANQRRYEGFQTAQNRQYEGFNQGRAAQYAGLNQARQAQQGAFGQQQAAEYAGRNQAFNRQYSGYLDANKNRANTMNDILNRTTFDYYRPEGKTSPIDTLFNAAAPSVGSGAGKWLAEYFKDKPENTGSFAGSSGDTGNGSLMNFIPKPGG